MTRPRLSIPRTGAALGLGLVFAANAFSTVVHAAEADEDAFRSWATTVNASARWSATYDSVGPGARDEIRVANLVLASVPAGVEIIIPDLRLAGPVSTEDGRLSATAVRMARARISNENIGVELADVSAADVSFPDFRAFGWSENRPLTSLVGAYALLADFAMSQGSARLIRISEGSKGVESVITYETVSVSSWADGQISELRSGPMRMESPSPDGIVRMSSGGLVSRGIDIGAIVHAFDPDAYGGGTGDGAWRTAVASAVYDGFAIDAPDIAVTIARVAAEDMRVRQTGLSFVAFADDALDDDTLLDDEAEVTRRVYDLMSAFSVGSFEVESVDVQAGGIDKFALSRFALTDASAERFGEMALEGFSAAVAGEGFVDAGRFALGDVRFPPRDKVLAAARPGNDSPEDDMLPLFGSLEIAGLDAGTARLPRTRLGRFRLDLDDYVDRLPTTVALEMSDVRFAASLVRQRRARELLAALGYDEVDADLGFRARWNRNDGTLMVDRIHFAMRDMGTLNGEARFRGLEEDIGADLDDLEGALKELEFAGGTMTFADDSAVARGLAMQAERMQVETEVFREQIAGALPFMLSFVGDPDFQRKIVPVLQTFIRTPGEVTVTAEPDEPVSIAALEELFVSAPQTIPDLLSVTLTGIAGLSSETGGNGTASDGELRPTLDPEVTPED